MIAPELEPVAGACLAINLAYLGLTRFRYRIQIRNAAKEQMSLFSRNGDQFPENIKKLDHYNQLRSLCELPNHDYEKAEGETSAAKIKGTVRGSLYQVLFSKHLDRYLSYLCAGLAAMTLVAGVAHQLGSNWAGLLPVIYAPITGGWWLFALTVAATMPVGLILLGRNIVHHIIVHAQFCRSQIELSMQSSIQTTMMPVVTTEGITLVNPANSQTA